MDLVFWSQYKYTYLSDIFSVNLRQIWVFPIPPIPQRRQEHLDIGPLLVQGVKIFPSWLSISFRPVNIRLEFGFWSTGIFICLSAGSTLTILVWAVWQKIHGISVNSLHSLQERLTKLLLLKSRFWALENRLKRESSWVCQLEKKNQWCKQLTEEFCSDSGRICTTGWGKLGNNGLWVLC